MPKNLLTILDKLKHLGFTHHMYHTDAGWHYDGALLTHFSVTEYDYYYDEHDKRIGVYSLTDHVLNIKGAGIIA